MSRAVELVIVGMTPDAGRAAVAAAREGRRVLVVDRSTDRGIVRRFRRSLEDADAVLRRIVIVSGVEVVCVDGIHEVEAVLLRRLESGMLIGINARAVLVSDRAQFGGLPARLATRATGLREASGGALVDDAGND